MRRSPQQRGRDFERKLAKQVGGRQQPNSGALKLTMAKGDVKTDDLLYDSKLTDKESYLLKLSVLNKIKTEALSQNRTPILLVAFSQTGEDFCILRRCDFDAMQEVYLERGRD